MEQEHPVYRASYINMVLDRVLNDFLENGAIADAPGEDYSKVITALDSYSVLGRNCPEKLSDPLFLAFENLVEQGFIDTSRCDYGEVLWLLGEAKRTRSAELATAPSDLAARTARNSPGFMPVI